jgi:hypothetical protein
VSLDFAVSQLPGWHTTIFPAVFCGRRDLLRVRHGADAADSVAEMCKLEDIITMRHIDLMCKVTLATGSIVGYAYLMELFIAWYSGSPYERFAFINRRRVRLPGVTGS